MNRGVIYPELVTGRADGFVVRAWHVVEGSSRRGEASCDLTERILEVPTGIDETARVVRAHELMHSRVSPHRPLDPWLARDLSPRALECAEELRINSLLGRLGFDVSLLRDGSEKLGGRRLAESGQWGEAVCFFMAVVGTGAEKDFLAGVRQGDPSWLGGLRAIRKRAVTLMASLELDELGATNVGPENVGAGYVQSTMMLARILTSSMEARPPLDAHELRRFRRSLELGGRRAPSGRFAPLQLDGDTVTQVRPRRGGIRRYRPSVTGTTMRYPGRMLTDDQRRGYARRVNAHGGVVVIDQSGSMDLDPDVLTKMLRRAPNALVLGYSHRPGDQGSTPNAWIIADRGAVVESCPVGNVGNGVDGPALEWAIGRRTGREPLIWVTDGQVTDSHDHPDDALSRHCATLVRRHAIRLARSLDDADRLLSSGSIYGSSTWVNFGRVGRKLMEAK